MIGAVLIFSACAKEPNSSDNDQQESTKDQAGDLIVDLASDPVSLDPHAANDGNSLYVMNAMYDTLVALGWNSWND